MSINLLTHYNNSHLRLNLRLLRALTGRLVALLGQTGRPVSIVFMDDPEIAGYNQTYRHKEGPTNVLSFPAENANELGDILISVETAWREAVEKGVCFH